MPHMTRSTQRDAARRRTHGRGELRGRADWSDQCNAAQRRMGDLSVVGAAPERRCIHGEVYGIAVPAGATGTGDAAQRRTRKDELRGSVGWRDCTARCSGATEKKKVM